MRRTLADVLKIRERFGGACTRPIANALLKRLGKDRIALTRAWVGPKAGRALSDRIVNRYRLAVRETAGCFVETPTP